MTIQRQYILPNCNLILEGIAAGTADQTEAPLTVLLNVAFQFPGMAEPLTGGRDFLEALIAAVNPYAQSVLSGVATPRPSAPDRRVRLSPKEGVYHHLQILQSEEPEPAPTPTDITLTTVQLFDLVEAIDQLLADPQTLPDLTLQVAPVSRRLVKPQEPLAKRAAPVAVGTSGLVAAAAAFFFIPVPDLERIRTDDRPQGQSSVQSTDVSEAPPPPTAGEPPSNRPVDAVTAATSLARLEAAPGITRPEVLETLEQGLVTTLTENLDSPATFDEALVYRVAVAETGELLGYKYENDAALLNVESTPLPALTYIPPNPEVAVQEPVAQFRVTFEPDGTVTAEPLP